MKTWAATFIDAAAPNFFQIQWVPSHLNDEGKEAERADKIERGITTEQRIHGNDRADELAKEGAMLHDDIAQLIIEADARKEVTRLTQNMMVQIWQQHAQVDDRIIAEDAMCDDAVEDCFCFGKTKTYYFVV